MARIVKGIILCLLAVIVMSHNTQALELNYDVSSLWNGSNPASTEWIYTDGGGSLTASGNFICGGGTDVRRKVWGIIFNFSNSISGVIQTGDVIEFRIALTSDNNANMNIDFAPVLYDSYGNFDIIDVNYQNAGVSSSQVKIIAMARSNGVHTLYLRRDNYNNPFFSMINTNGWECGTAGVWTAYRVKGDGVQAIINAINSNNSSQAIEDAKDAIVDAIEDAQDREEQAAQDAVDDAQDGADDSQDDVDAASQSLITAMTQIGTALMNTQASDCTINTATNHFTMGTLDLCSNVPQGIRTFVSGLLAIVLTPIILYYCFHIVNYIYNLFQEFQR